MKMSNCLKIVALAVPMLLVSCHSHKKVVEEPAVVISPEQTELLGKVDSHVQKKTTYVGSKLKFSVSVGDQQLSLTGNLRMKRNDVIRLQLMAFGFVEAALCAYH